MILSQFDHLYGSSNSSCLLCFLCCKQKIKLPVACYQQEATMLIKWPKHELLVKQYILLTPFGITT